MNKVLIFFLLCAFHINASEVIIDKEKYDMEKTIELILMMTNISDNDLDNICKLNNLKELKIVFSKLPKILDSIGDLKNLNMLHLRCVKIDYLPESICSLTNLEDLNVSGNKIEFLPEAIGNLTKLRSLSIAGNTIENKIEKLPQSIANLTNLSFICINWYECGLIAEHIAEDNFDILLPLLNFNYGIFNFINTFKEGFTLLTSELWEEIKEEVRKIVISEAKFLF